MRTAEALATERRFVGIWLDASGFQAPAFYGKLGYEIFGRLPDHPRTRTGISPQAFGRRRQEPCVRLNFKRPHYPAPLARAADVATGARYVAALAKRRGARPVGLDFSEAQVKLARSTYPDVEFRRGDAQALPFEAGIFDTVVIGFGLNHLPEPEQAFREAFRVLRSGGRMAFTVWAAPKQGEGFGIVLEIITQHEVPRPRACLQPPPYFRFTDAAEPTGVRERRVYSIGHEHRAAVLAASTPDEVFAAFSEGAVRATAMLRAQPPDRQQAMRHMVRREVEQLGANGEYRGGTTPQCPSPSCRLRTGP